MGKEKKSRFGGFNVLGIPLDPTLGVGDRVLDHIDESIEAQKKKEAASRYWARCPSCGKKVVRQELLRRGCYACGWQGTESELEVAEATRRSGSIQSEVEEVGLPEKKQQQRSYYIFCPRCGRKVVTKELEERGCFVCEYKPSENKI